VSTLFVSMRTLAEGQLRDLQETIDRFLAERGAYEGIDAGSLQERLDSGDITLIDVRPAEEFAAGHLPGAINIPTHEIETRLTEIPPGREVVAYCRGPFCVMAVDAVSALRERGFRARHFDRSIADWRASGLPVETGHEDGA
jgi:rhodanese-related sulfurtransferase